MSDHCEISGIVRHNRYYDLGNASSKFGNHWFRFRVKVLDQGLRFQITNFS